MPTRDKFVEAYDAWKRASDQHSNMMTAVMGGGPLDAEAMKQKRDEIELLHANWMELAAGFVPVRMPGAHGGKRKET